ncbi:hypothetical protein D9M68_859470 [compost metagenome]
MVEAYPAGASGSIDQCIQDSPVCYGIRTIFHRFCLTVRRGYRTTVQVIAADYDRCFYLTFSYQLVEQQTSFLTLAHA